MSLYILLRVHLLLQQDIADIVVVCFSSTKQTLTETMASITITDTKVLKYIKHSNSRKQDLVLQTRSVEVNHTPSYIYRPIRTSNSPPPKLNFRLISKAALPSLVRCKCPTTPLRRSLWSLYRACLPQRMPRELSRTFVLAGIREEEKVDSRWPRSTNPEHFHDQRAQTCNK